MSAHCSAVEHVEVKVKGDARSGGRRAWSLSSTLLRPSYSHSLELTSVCSV